MTLGRDKFARRIAPKLPRSIRYWVMAFEVGKATGTSPYIQSPLLKELTENFDYRGYRR